MLWIRDVYLGSQIRLFSIPDPNISIPDPGSEYSHPWSRIRIKKIWFGLFIPDPGLGSLLLTIPDPGSRGQKGTGSWIPDPDPQHWFKHVSGGEHSSVRWFSLVLISPPGGCGSLFSWPVYCTPGPGPLAPAASSPAAAPGSPCTRIHPFKSNQVCTSMLRIRIRSNPYYMAGSVRACLSDSIAASETGSVLFWHKNLWLFGNFPFKKSTLVIIRYKFGRIRMGIKMMPIR